MKKLLGCFLCLMLLVFGVSGAGAAIISTGDAPLVYNLVGTTTDGYDISASASFEIVSDNLVIELTNTSPSDMTKQTQILQGLVWDQIGDGTLSVVSATADSIVNSLNNNSVTNVGGEWAYYAGAPDPALGTADHMIYGAGTYHGGAPDGTNPVYFGGPNLGGPTDNPDGPQYGIISAGAIAGNIAGFAAHPNDDDWGLVQDSILFVLGLGDDFLTGPDTYSYEFGNVVAFFGTSPGDTAVPEPGTMLLLGTGLVCLAGFGRKKFKI